MIQIKLEIKFDIDETVYVVRYEKIHKLINKGIVLDLQVNSNSILYRVQLIHSDITIWVNQDNIYKNLETLNNSL